MVTHLRELIESCQEMLLDVNRALPEGLQSHGQGPPFANHAREAVVRTLIIVEFFDPRNLRLQKNSYIKLPIQQHVLFLHNIYSLRINEYMLYDMSTFSKAIKIDCRLFPRSAWCCHMFSMSKGLLHSRGFGS